MKKMGIGVQLYSVRREMEKDMDGTLAAIAKMGYEYVEFAGYFGRTSEEIKTMLDKYSLKCISVHQGLDFFDNDPEGAVAYLKGFGVKYVVIPWYDKELLGDDEAWKVTAARFNGVSALLAKHGMKLLYHNHDFEFVKLPDGRYIHERIMSEVQGIDPQLDTCWVHYAGIDPTVELEKYKGRINSVHLKDFACKALGAGPVYALIDNEGKTTKGSSREANGFEFRPLGMGIQDMPAIIAAAEKYGADYLIVEQDESVDRPPMEAVEISRKYLASLGL